MKTFGEAVDPSKYKRTVPTVSAVLRDGAIIEMVCRPDERSTGFVVWRDGTWSHQQTVVVDPLNHLAPYAYENNLVKNQVVLFPSEPQEYESEQALLAEIQSFIHRYVD